ncbi:MAG: biotin--[Treponema sp.]|nr:biotin--[acetyl-CoA-carboxylase] ligase [Treponema sp.]
MTTKEKIIQLLSENKDEFVSGEDLALKLSLSRAAVWKAIKALESDGYKIEAVTNRGYRICALPDKLDPGTLAAASGLERGQVIIFDSIDSTNKEAKRRIVEGAKLHKTLFAAEKQTAGRGRLERKFLSPAKKGVYFTLVYCPKTQVNPAVMTSAAAVSVCQAVEELYKTDCSVKWVNDIFSGGKKIAGILTEGITNFES